MNKNVRKRFEKRKRLFAKQRGLCYYCAKPMLLARGPADARLSPNHITFDHIVPKSQGGNLNDNNLVAACFSCNQARKDKDARLFMLERMGLLGERNG